MSTFTEYQKLSSNWFNKGLYTTINTESELGPHLQMMSINGNAFEYSRENVNPVASFVGDEGELVDTTPQFTSSTETLKTLYVQTPLNLKTEALARVEDPRVIHHSKMMKSYARKLENAIINGRNAVDANEFDGLLRRCESETRMMAMDDGVVDGPGAAETELTLQRLREMIDTVQPGKPDILLMNRTMRRKLTNLMYAAGGGIQLDSISMFGRRVELFDTIPIVISDYLSNSEDYNDSGTWSSSTATTIIAAKFGEEKEGFTLLHNGGTFNAEIQDLGIRKNRNERVFRMVSYPGAVVFSPLSIAALGGIDSAA